MAKFIFRMQSVLDVKTRLEQQQRNVFARTRLRLTEEEDKLEALKNRLLSYQEEGASMRSKALKVREIIENQEAIEIVKGYIEEQTATVRMWERTLEEERLKLVEMMKERKTYERLREKAFETYLEEEKHREAVENDEHNSYVYGAKVN